MDNFLLFRKRSSLTYDRFPLLINRTEEAEGSNPSRSTRKPPGMGVFCFMTAICGGIQGGVTGRESDLLQRAATGCNWF